MKKRVIIILYDGNVGLPTDLYTLALSVFVYICYMKINLGQSHIYNAEHGTQAELGTQGYQVKRSYF